MFCQRSESVWMDKKTVTMLCTLPVTHTAQRKDGTRLAVECTDAVVLYYQYKALTRVIATILPHQNEYYKYIFWFNPYYHNTYEPAILF